MGRGHSLRRGGYVRREQPIARSNLLTGAVAAAEGTTRRVRTAFKCCSFTRTRNPAPRQAACCHPMRAGGSATIACQIIKPTLAEIMGGHRL